MADPAALVDAAIVRRLVRVAVLERRARELWAPRRNGCAIVLRVLADSHPDLALARSEWEALAVRLLAEHGLPAPELDHEVRIGNRRYFLDLAWPAERVYAEFDGFSYHGGREPFDRDRERQNDLASEEWLPFRLTSTALRADPAAALSHLAAALVRRRTSVGHRSGHMWPIS